MQRIIIWNQILMGIAFVVLLALDMRLYALYALIEMCIAFLIWWKVVL